jgi:hypothetical protein
MASGTVLDVEVPNVDVPSVAGGEMAWIKDSPAIHG